MSNPKDDVELSPTVDAGSDEVVGRASTIDGSGPGARVAGARVAGARVAGAPRAAGARVGRYVVQRQLGAGGMGVVYEARDTELGRLVALKLVHLRAGEVAAAQARLRREAQAMARLSDASVVTIHDIGSDGDDVFVAMELLAGGTLRDWMARSRSWPEVVATLVKAGRGLAAAHEVGLVHRDFKPENVLIGARGEVRVGDFGLARTLAAHSAEPVAAASAAEPDAGEHVTRAGSIVGTPAYMAPEQLDGGEVDARSDQFAFCVTLYEALEGARPFPVGAILDEAHRAWTRAELPAWVRDAVERGLRIDPAARWPSMTALLAALTPAPVVRPRAARGRLPTVALAGLAACAVVAAIVWWPRDRTTAAPPGPAAPPATLTPSLLLRESTAVPARHVAMSGDGTLLAITSEREVWLQRRGERDRQLIAIPGDIEVVRVWLDHTGHQLFVVGMGKALWESYAIDVASQRATQLDMSASLPQISPHPDGGRVLISSAGQYGEVEPDVTMVDVDDQERHVVVPFATAPIRGAVWSADGRAIAGVTVTPAGAAVIVIGLEADQPTGRTTLGLAAGRRASGDVAWTPDNALLVGVITEGKDGARASIERWTLGPDHALIARDTLYTAPQQVVITHLTTCGDEVLFTERNERRQVATLDLSSPAAATIVATGAFSDDGVIGWTDDGALLVHVRHAAGAGQRGVIAVGDGGVREVFAMSSETPVALVDGALVLERVDGSGCHRTRWQDGVSHTLAAAPCGRIACAGDRTVPCVILIGPAGDGDAALHRWDPVTGAVSDLVQTLPPVAMMGNYRPDLAVSADGQTLAVASWQGVTLVELSTGRKRSLDHDDMGYEALAFDPDGVLHATRTRAGRPYELVRFDALGEATVLHHHPSWWFASLRIDPTSTRLALSFVDTSQTRWVAPLP